MTREVRIEAQIGQLEDLIPQMHVSAPGVSGWSVGMHLHHSALAMSWILARLLEPDEQPPRGPSPAWFLVKKMGRIPRGGAPAPERTQPSPGVTPDDLQAGLEECWSLLGRSPEMEEEAWFEHFALGVLKRDDALRFIDIHNAHHLDIIRDVLDARDG